MKTRVAELRRGGGSGLQRGGRLLVVAALVIAAVPAARPAFAQSDSAPAPPRRAGPAITWGKWAAAAAALGTTALGIHQHNAGNGTFHTLVLYCGQVATCTLGPDGRYLDARAEATYQRVAHFDRSARLWLAVGQVAAVGSAVLFVLELKHETGPPNIPFNGITVESGNGVTRVGYRIPFRIGTGR
jgi:hypothetical protein